MDKMQVQTDRVAAGYPVAGGFVTLVGVAAFATLIANLYRPFVPSHYFNAGMGLVGTAGVIGGIALMKRTKDVAFTVLKSAPDEPKAVEMKQSPPANEGLDASDLLNQMSHFGEGPSAPALSLVKPTCFMQP